MMVSQGSEGGQAMPEQWKRDVFYDWPKEIIYPTENPWG